MNELIKVTYDNDRPAVSARDLHDFLEVDTPYHKWFPRMCGYGFTENEDFMVTDNFVPNSAGGPQHQKDAILTIDMAKELCMIQRNEKGKLARQYFIQVEKDWNSPEKVMARALQIAKDRIMRLETKITEDKPKVLFADAVSASHSSGAAPSPNFLIVGELAKLLRQNGVDIGQNRLFAWLRDNGYLIRLSGTDYNMPTQRSMEMGLFSIKETAITRSDGSITISKTCKITGKGQQYFVEKFLSKRGQPP